MEFETVIRGGTITTAETSTPGDVGIVEGKVAAIGVNLPTGAIEIDATGLLVMPGMIDVHTHFDHMVELFNAKNADDFSSGSRAAAAGGITTVVNFAFQKRGRSMAEAIEHELEVAEGRSYVDYGIHQCVTDLSVPGILSEIPRLAGEGFASVKCFTTTSTYQLPDADFLQLLDLSRSTGVMVSCHAEDEALVNHLTQHLIRNGHQSVENLPHARPPAAEEIATYRSAMYANVMGVPVYFVHLSSKAALRAVRRVREDGGELYVETRPVYLFLDEGVYKLPDRQGNKYVCLPPLRHPDNQEELWRGIRNGEIQTYATDHAPWQSTQKLDPDKAFHEIPAGVSNVQTSIGMLFAEGVGKGRISAQQFVAIASTNPAKLFGMWPRKGSLSPGADADVVLMDPNREVEVLSQDSLSAADYDPYEGYRGKGWPILTLVRGRSVARNGEIVSPTPIGQFVKRSAFMPL